MSDETITTPDDADFKDWIRALNLKIAAVQADLDYNTATSGRCTWCGDDCDCHDADFAYLDRLVEAREALQRLIPVEA